MATIKFIQAQKFSLAGSGASIGDTTLLLQSMVGIDGTNIVTADIGVQGFGTLEPGNGSQEEAISFTGITQNSNGTATLTGVSTVLFKSPYTATSGIAKTHAGASTFILSNDAAFYGNILSYIDTAVVSGGVPATTTVLGLNKMSVAPVSPASPIAVSDNDPRMISATGASYLGSVINTGIPYAVATGTSAAYTATLASSFSTLASGSFLNFLVPTNNATSVTLNVNSLGAKSITKNFNATLASADLVAGQVAQVVYDGTRFQLESPASSSFQFKTGNTTHDISVTGSQTIAHGLALIPKILRIYTVLSGANTITSSSTGVYDGATQNVAYVFTDTTSTTSVVGVDGSNIIRVLTIATGTQNITATVTVDVTNINLTWSKTGTPTGTASLIWEVTG